EEVIDLIADAGFGILGTVEGDQPRARPMMPILSDDSKQLLVALLGDSRTIEQVKNNPKVEVCFLDRKMWFARVTGDAKITEDSQKKEKLWSNIPMLRQYFGGIDDANFVLMEIDITQVEASTPHQKKPDVVSLT
ncbi:hypothetical protein MNBD_BACTEROID05-472, partial [hydrothermal vent metagenome]